MVLVTFITRNGSTLLQNGQPFRFSGTNIHWLGLDDSKNGAYPSQVRVDNAFATVAEMGATVVRSHTLGTTVGSPTCIEPALNQFNEQAFDSIDYAIKSARNYNIRLIIPLVDNWHFMGGGKHTFTEWRGLTNEDLFYSDPTVIQDFKNHINHVLTHVNKYTGIALKDDPTILAWELGNELTTETAEWAKKMAEYIKSIDANHLIADGREVRGDGSRTTITSIDMYYDHFYPLDTMQMTSDAALVNNAGKVFYVGEYDWAEISGKPAQGTIAQDKTTAANGIASAKIDVTQLVVNEIDSWYIQVQQGNLHITAGTSYTITFWAKASQAKKINVSIQQDFEPYTCYTTHYYILSTIWQQYTFTYTPTITQTNLLAFNLAYGSVGQVWIDNVSFTSGTSGNLIQNPSFENTGTNWLSPWGFLVYQPTTTSSTLTNFLTAIEDPTKYIAGDLFWQLYGHDELQGYDNGDSYTLHYPGDTTDMQNRAQQLRSHTYKMGGLPVPAARTPDAPYLHEVTLANAGANIDWRGSVPSVSYIVERSIDNINWQVIGSGITDNNTPWVDTTIGQNTAYSYRVKGVNIDNVSGAYSNVQTVSVNSLRNGSFEYPDYANGLSFWLLNIQGNASGTVTHDTSDKIDGNFSARIDITQPDPTLWHLQLNQGNIAFVAEKNYTLSFWAKASTVRSMVVGINQNYSPYNPYFQQTVNLTTSWQQFSFPFTPTVNEANALLNFNVAQNSGQVWIGGVSIMIPKRWFTPRDAQ